MTRAAMPILPLFVPTISFYLLTKFNKMPKSFLKKSFVETLIFLVALTYAPPMACGFFPQITKVKAEDLEPQFHDIKDQNGN